MKCPHCGKEISDEEIARYFAAKGGGRQGKREEGREAQGEKGGIMKRDYRGEIEAILSRHSRAGEDLSGSVLAGAPDVIGRDAHGRDRPSRPCSSTRSAPSARSQSTLSADPPGPTPLA